MLANPLNMVSISGKKQTKATTKIFEDNPDPIAIIKIGAKIFSGIDCDTTIKGETIRITVLESDINIAISTAPPSPSDNPTPAIVSVIRKSFSIFGNSSIKLPKMTDGVDIVSGGNSSQTVNIAAITAPYRAIFRIFAVILFFVL